MGGSFALVDLWGPSKEAFHGVRFSLSSARPIYPSTGVGLDPFHCRRCRAPCAPILRLGFALPLSLTARLRLAPLLPVSAACVKAYSPLRRCRVAIYAGVADVMQALWTIAQALIATRSAQIILRQLLLDYFLFHDRKASGSLA